MQRVERIVPARLEKLRSVRGYAPAVRVDGLLFVSGMLGRDDDLQVIVDPEAQLVRLFENLGLVLHEAGCGFPELVELTGYFTHLRRHYELFMAVRDRFVAEPYPAQTMIGAAELAQPGLICELKAVAAIPDGR